MTVKAHEKGTGKSESLTIKNEKGRLSQDEIDRMVNEAETFAEQDKVVKEKLDSKHQLENYIHSMRNQVDDKEKLANKLSDDEKKAINAALKEAKSWLDANQEAEKEDNEEHMKTLQKVCDPIISKVYQ